MRRCFSAGVVERPLFCVGKLDPPSLLSIAHRKIDGRVLLFITIGSTGIFLKLTSKINSQVKKLDKFISGVMIL